MSGFVVLGIVVFAYAALAAKLDRFSITAPLVLMGAGAIFGPGALDLLHGAATEESVKVLAEVALAVILFTDASSISAPEAREEIGMAGRLLAIGAPLTILAGTVACHLLFPSIPWAACALIGALLAPTDAALGLAVVTSPKVPIGVRNALNIESGLNDGLVTPFVYFFLALTLAQSTHGHWVAALGELIGAVGLGAALGYVLGEVGRRAKRSGGMSIGMRQLMVLAAALLCYAAALGVDANGFVAVYVAGFTFSIGSRGLFREDLSLVEDTGLYGSFVVWLLFGAYLLGPVLSHHLDWTVVLYAVISLTVVRMLPVAIALLGARCAAATVAFMGWFGPRGLASVVFTIIVLDALHADPHLHLMVAIATWTIGLSVVLHGLSSGPFASAYGTVAAGLPDGAREKVMGRLEGTERRRSLNPEVPPSER